MVFVSTGLFSVVNQSGRFLVTTYDKLKHPVNDDLESRLYVFLPIDATDGGRSSMGWA